MNLYQGKRYSIGQMRHRLVVEEESTTLDSDTGQPIRTWTTLYASEPAAYVEVRGGESFRGNQIEAGVNAVFTVRYREDWDTTKRISFDGQTYGIVFVKKVNGFKRYLEIHCRMIVDGA